MSLEFNNKLLLYKAILKPIWTYGTQLWGTASTSKIEILECFQSKALRIIVDAPWYVPNNHIRWDLQTTASGIPPKLHQLDNSKNTKRQFEFVSRLGESRIINYSACNLRGLICVQCGKPAGQNGVQCKSTSELLMCGGGIRTSIPPPLSFSPEPSVVSFAL
jgi:hypothetical protein